jgi:hypothetical protein
MHLQVFLFSSAEETGGAELQSAKPAHQL